MYLGFAVPHLGQSHISSRILFRSLIVVKITMVSPRRHDVGCEQYTSQMEMILLIVHQ